MTIVKNGAIPMMRHGANADDDGDEENRIHPKRGVSTTRHSEGRAIQEWAQEMAPLMERNHELEELIADLAAQVNCGQGPCPVRPTVP